MLGVVGDHTAAKEKPVTGRWPQESFGPATRYSLVGQTHGIANGGSNQRSGDLVYGDPSILLTYPESTAALEQPDKNHKMC